MNDKECCGECTPEKMAKFMKAIKPIIEKEFPKCAEKMKECCGEDCCSEENIAKCMDSMKGCPFCHMMKMHGGKSDCCKSEGGKEGCCK